MTVTVEIPTDESCRYSTGDRTGKPCVFAKYTKKWDAYSCALHNRILKGNQDPRKCQQCIDHCGKDIGENNG